MILKDNIIEKKYFQMANKQMKKYATALVLRRNKVNLQ